MHGGTDVNAPQGMEQIFSRRLVVWGFPLVAISFIATLLAGVLGPELFEPVDVAPSAYSRSAVGHRAFVDLLRELDLEVVVSRANSAHKASEGGVLLIAEPAEFEDEDGDAEYPWLEMLRWNHRTRAMVVVLPKWHAIARPDAPRFAQKVRMRPEYEVRRILNAISGDERWDTDEWTIRRPPNATSWESPGVDGLDGIPDLPFPQLIEHPDLEPWLENVAGTLIGHFSGEDGVDCIIVSDPDLISNHGIVREDGTNALVAVQLVERLLGDETARRVVVDETCRGGLAEGFWREALRFPMVLVILHLALVFGATLWAALGRFGAPTPERVGLEAGNRLLIRSTAELLRAGGHHRPATIGYLRMVVARTVAALRGPATGTLSDQVQWLAAREERRGLSEDTENIEELVARAQVLRDRPREDVVRELALAIDRWRWEMVHGPVEDPGGR